MNTIILGNIVIFAGAMIMVLTGLIKKKNHILLAQCAQFLIMGIGNLILGGVIGFISNIISIFRNLYCYKFEFTTKIKLFFIVVSAALSLAVNTEGVYGLLPVLAACIFTWFLDTKSEITLKCVILVCQVLWIVYDFSISNFTGMVFDALTVVTNIMGIVMILKDKKQN